MDAQEIVGGQARLSSDWSVEEWKRSVGSNSGAVLLMKSGSQLLGGGARQPQHRRFLSWSLLSVDTAAQPSVRILASV